MRLAHLNVFPVKALRGMPVASSSVEPWGLRDDRRWMVVDAAGRFVTQRTHGGMALIAAAPTATGIVLRADGVALEVGRPDQEAPEIEVEIWRDRLRARLASAAASHLLSERLGIACRLVWMHDTFARPTDPDHAPHGGTVSFADGFPVLVATLASLGALNAHLPAPVPMTRFRPNLVIEGGQAWEEDRWRRIRIGNVSFAVVKPCARCIVTTIDPETGLRPDKAEPLRTLGRLRRDARGGVMFGQNLIPENSGILRVGDEMEVLESGAPNVLLAPL